MRKLLLMALTVIAVSFGFCQDPATKVVSAAGNGSSQPVVSLANARRFISRAINSPVAMTTVMKRLSAEDQKKFLAEVNRAIDSRPGSPEAKAALFLNVNRAALKGARPGNLSELVAEVFATVPPEALTLVNERLADDLFNRAADPSVSYTDDQFLKISENLMKKVSARTASTDNSAVRDVFAVLMLVRASNGTPANLAETLTAGMPEEVRGIARSEWIPAAMGSGQSKTYEPMLGTAGADSQPDIEQALVIAGPQMLEALLDDLSGGSKSPVTASHQRNPVVDAIQSHLQYMLPQGSGSAGDGMESSGYQWQTTK